MGFSRMAAADKGVQAFDPMDQPLGQQEIQRPVDGRRGARNAIPLQFRQQIIGTHWLVARPHQFQNPAALGCQPHPARGTDLFRRAHRFGDTLGVIPGPVGGMACVCHPGLISEGREW